MSIRLTRVAPMADTAAADLVQHPRDRHLNPASSAERPSPGALRRPDWNKLADEDGDIRFSPRPGSGWRRSARSARPRRCRAGDLRYRDEDIGPAGRPASRRSATSWLEVRRNRAVHDHRGAQRQSIALCNPFQCRVAVTDDNTSADSRQLRKEPSNTARRKCVLTSHT